MAYILGKDAVMTINGSPADTAGDVTLDKAFTEVAIKTRGKDRVMYLRGLEDIPIDFDLIYNTSDAACQALAAAYASGAAVEVTFGGAGGISESFLVTKFGENQPLEDAVSISVSLRLDANEGEVPA